MLSLPPLLVDVYKVNKMTGLMFDLEGCEDAVLIDNETTSEQYIKARN